jgi:hypothetical protein
MNTVIIAAAPITKDKFHPVWAEFPISDKTLLKCVGSHKATNEVLAGACVMLGLNPDECVSGMYYRLPERENRPFEMFLMDLRRRYTNAKNEIEQKREDALRQKRENLFAVVMSL